MSVIAGIWHIDGDPIDRCFLSNISQRAREYGPDSEEIRSEKDLGMLYRAFHTTQESRQESQPYESAGGYVVLWDGRLDNREELISQLADQLRSDRTDVAIVGAAFDRWGTGTFSKLTGDWAIAIWNPRRRELLLARDYIGVKHLFFYHTRSKVVWSNYLSALALSGERFTLCAEYMAGYLAFYPDSHLTPYSEIQAVPPGSFVRIQTHDVRTSHYW